METKSKCGPEIRRRKPDSRNSETHEWAMESARNREGEILTTDCRMNADRGLEENVRLLIRSQDGLHCETNSLSLRSGERVRERGAWEIRNRFQAMFSRLSPLPGPLPARSSRGEGEDEAPPAPRAFVAYPADSSVVDNLNGYLNCSFRT